MRTTLSVLIPVYNTGEYLRSCLDSIISQTYKDFEIVIVDDGSTDGGAAICDEYDKKYGFVKVIHNNHSGVIETRKTALANSSGEYISFVDSDDYLDSDMYEFLMGRILKYDADMAVCGILTEHRDRTEKSVNGYGNALYTKERLLAEVYPTMLFDVSTAHHGTPPSFCNKIIRRRLIEKALMNADGSIEFGEDAICTYPCLLDSEKVYFAAGKYFYHYRMINTSMTHTYDEKLFDKFMLVPLMLKRAFEERGFDYSEQLDCYTARYLLECIRKELLLNRSRPLSARIKKIKKYLDEPRIKNAFDAICRYKFDFALDLKLRLAQRGNILLLYMVYKTKRSVTRSGAVDKDEG